MSGFWSMENVADFEGVWVDAKDDYWSPFVPNRVTSDGKSQKLNAVSTALIYLLPCIEIEEITAENASEVFVRVRMLENALGRGVVNDLPALIVGRENNLLQQITELISFNPSIADMIEGALSKMVNARLTLQDIRQHVGMRVGADVSFPPFHEALIGHLRSQATKALKHETESMTSTEPSPK